MRTELHSLSWPDADPRMEEAQARVFRHFTLPVNRHKRRAHHGPWMDEVLRVTNADVIGFFDNDCIPLRPAVVQQTVRYVLRHKTFFGLAQASNHIGTKAHVFAAPAFFVIPKQVWLDLGSPSFAQTPRSDVAEEVSYIAEEKGLRYRAYFPTHFDAEPTEGVWRLGNYGFYGVGTVFGDAVYHLYEGRKKQNVDLFVRRCEEVVNGTFTTQGMHRSLAHYDGRIVP